ncbi:MAG: transposase [Chloroflexota bacterium]
MRDGTAKLLTLFHPATGEVHVQDVTSTTNAVLHGWLKDELTAILATLPEAVPLDQEATRALWEAWRVGLTAQVTMPAELPPVRLLLIFDNLVGHTSADLLCWLFAHGVMPLYMPLGGSWLNMAESIQRILKHCALDGQHPQTPQEIIDALEATARVWNRDPTPFAWGSKRAARRQRARERRHAQAGSGACCAPPPANSPPDAPNPPRRSE